MTQNNEAPISPMLKMYAGFSPETEDDEIRDYFKEGFPTEIEKPCGILGWCPYGPLVEDFPLHGQMHGDAEFGRQPLATPSSCMVFGHDCPVFYVAEPFADLDAVAENCLCDECRAKREASKSTDDADGDA